LSAVPRLHAVTDDRTLERDGWLDQALEVLEAGGPRLAVHVRGRRTAGARLFEYVRRLMDRAGNRDGWVVVNDRIDVALASGADAVHLSARSLDVATARRILGEDAAVGVSLHAHDAPAAQRAEGADYAFVGNIFDTPSHEGALAMGAAGLAKFVERAWGLPVVAIGGIGAEHVAELVACGAHGVAVIRAVWDRPSPADAATELLRAIEEAIDA
jgi:thiamine-phosphate pyrophosphorylase